MTPEERAELEALKAKSDLSTEEKARLEALLQKEKGSDKQYSEDYVKELRQEAAKYRTKAKETEALLAKFDGIDPEQIKQILEDKKASEQKKLEEKGEFEKLRQQMKEQFDKDLQAERERQAALEADKKALEYELNNTMVENQVTAAAAAAKAINTKVVEMIAKQSLKVKVEDGRKIVEVVDAKGDVRFDIRTGKPLTVTQLLEEMKQSEEYAHLFAGAKVGGGSGSTTFNGQRIENPWKKETLNLTMQGKIVRDNPELAKRLKAEAGV